MLIEIAQPRMQAGGQAPAYPAALPPAVRQPTTMYPRPCVASPLRRHLCSRQCCLPCMQATAKQDAGALAPAHQLRGRLRSGMFSRMGRVKSTRITHARSLLYTCCACAHIQAQTPKEKAQPSAKARRSPAFLSPSPGSLNGITPGFGRMGAFLRSIEDEMHAMMRVGHFLKGFCHFLKGFVDVTALQAHHEVTSMALSQVLVALTARAAIQHAIEHHVHAMMRVCAA